MFYIELKSVRLELLTSIHPTTNKLLQLSFNLKRLKIQFDVNVADGVATNVANDVCPV